MAQHAVVVFPDGTAMDADGRCSVERMLRRTARWTHPIASVEGIRALQDRDLEDAGDLGGDELPDVRGAVGAALDPAFGALDQDGVVDVVFVAQGGDREARGDLAGAFLGGGVAECCGRIGQSVRRLIHNMSLLVKRRQ